MMLGSPSTSNADILLWKYPDYGALDDLVLRVVYRFLNQLLAAHPYSGFCILRENGQPLSLSSSAQEDPKSYLHFSFARSCRCFCTLTGSYTLTSVDLVHIHTSIIPTTSRILPESRDRGYIIQLCTSPHTPRLKRIQTIIFSSDQRSL